MQIHKLGAENDYNILVDADVLLSKHMPDLTNRVSENSVGVYMTYPSKDLLLCEDQLPRQLHCWNGEPIGVATNLCVIPKRNHGFWKPFEQDWKDIRLNLKREFIVDELCASINTKNLGATITGLLHPHEFLYYKHFEFNTKADQDYRNIFEHAKYLFESDF